jgi:hypothetical protein
MARHLPRRAADAVNRLANAGHEGRIVVQRLREMKGDERSDAQSEHYEDLVNAGGSTLPRSCSRPCKTLRPIAPC